MMQLLPPERNTPVITPAPINDFIMHDYSLEESVSAQSDCFRNNVIEPAKEIMPDHRNEIIANLNSHQTKCNNELTNTPNYLIENGEIGMPKIIPESITNITYSDEFGLPINESKVIITNGEINHLNCSIGKFVASVVEKNINCKSAANKNNVASLRIEDNDGKVNIQDHNTINFDTVNDPKEISNVEMNRDGLDRNFRINVDNANIYCKVTANNTNVPRIKFEPSDDIIKPGNGAIHFEMKVSRPSSDSNTVLNTDVNFESSSVDGSSIEAIVKTEVDIKTDPTENIVKRLEEFGDNYTVSIFDFEDPFLIVEISDSSDDDEV